MYIDFCYLIQLLTANRVKKGYYIRRLKESLWSTFGNRIRPFEDNYSKQQMKDWKNNANVQKVHEELYSPIDPDDPSSDTYTATIIKCTFTSESERTTANAIWAQSVLEAIFDKTHLSTKIDMEVVDQWTEVLTDTDGVSLYIILLISSKITNVKILY